MVAFLFGILMVLDADAIDFEQTWIIMGIGGIAISMVLGMGYLASQTKQLVAELTAEDPAAEPRLTAISRVALLDLVILLVVVGAMVTKPGL